jgi:hypothetical protein
MNIRVLLATAAIALVAVAANPAKADIVTNGDFATGDFTGWSLTGDLSGGSVVTHTDNVSQPTGPGNGNMAALGTFGGILNVSQTIATKAGQTYDLSFFLEVGDGSVAPDSFNTLVNGADVSGLSISNSGATGWDELDAQFTASGSATTLDFQVSNDASFFNVADVSVDVPEPSSLALLMVGIVGLVGYTVRRRGNATPTAA